MDFLPQILTPIPGPRSKEMAVRLKTFEAPTVTFFSETSPIFWKRAKGIHVWDADDNRYIDFTSAFGVASLGHGDPDVVEAVQEQSQWLCHSMGDVHPACVKGELCQKLSEITFERWSGGKKKGQTILGNSGFEAVEAALKTARLFTGKRGVIAFEGAYHGLGYGALESTWRKDFRQPFQDQLGHFVEFASFPRESGDPEINQKRLVALEKQIQEICQRVEVGAILVEPIQGRGGEVIPPMDFLPLLRKICDKKRILLIVDEIYTGFWRTGKWFAVEHTGVVPDLICLGKALTGCLPLSACMGKSEIMAAWPESTGEALHTSTFLGNPMACAAALASVWKFEMSAPQWNIEGKGRKLILALRKALAKKSLIRDIRGMGLLVGIEFKEAQKSFAVRLCDRLLQKGMIALPSGSKGEVLALAPPLVIGSDVLDWGALRIAESLEGLV